MTGLFFGLVPGEHAGHVVWRRAVVAVVVVVGLRQVVASGECLKHLLAANHLHLGSHPAAKLLLSGNTHAEVHAWEQYETLVGSTERAGTRRSSSPAAKHGSR